MSQVAGFELLLALHAELGSAGEDGPILTRWLECARRELGPFPGSADAETRQHAAEILAAFEEAAIVVRTMGDGAGARTQEGPLECEEATLDLPEETP